MSFAIRGIAFVMLVCTSFSVWGATDTRLGTDADSPPKRFALLIGNSGYEHLNPLKNPKNDVDQLAEKLTQLGFETAVKYDLNHSKFVDALNEFHNKLSPGNIALFYYSGHGVQSRGTNYLIPIDMSDQPTEIFLDGSGISLTLVRETLDIAKLSLIILDACRSLIPRPTKGLGPGLAPLFSRGSLIAYAADEGQAASDNDQEDLSLFTKLLIKELDNGDENLCQLFEAVRAAVDNASNHVQFPFVYDGVIGNFVFNRSATKESQKLARISSTEGKSKVWEEIKSSQDLNDFVAYLQPEFAEPNHVSVAEERLKTLMSSIVKAAAVVPLQVRKTIELTAVANQAERLFYEEAYPAALKEYKKLLASEPADVGVLYNYATCLLHLDRREDAIAAFSRAIKADPEFPWAYYNRGIAEHLKGDFQAAIADYNITLKRRPTYALAYNNLAVAKRDLGDLHGAENDVQTAIRLDSHYPPAFFNGAQISYGLGKMSDAAQYVDQGKSLAISGKF